MKTQQNNTPVFIIGIAHRCGSNYLHSLILKHKGVVSSRVNGEDFLLSQSNHLVAYVDFVAHNWNPVWNNSKDQLMQAIEAGLMTYIVPENTERKYILSKTPVPYQAANFNRIFSSGYLILLTRNGQDLVESYTRSFRHRFEYAVRTWVKGADTINQILDVLPPQRVILVRYEELYANPEKELRKIFSHIGLDPEAYNYEEARNADVIGSSETRTKTGELNWTPVKKSEEFNPMGRSENWSVWKHHRFNWLAGEQSLRFGYSLNHSSKSPLFYMYNMLLSVYYHVHKTFFRMIHVYRAMPYGKKAMIKAWKKDF